MLLLSRQGTLHSAYASQTNLELDIQSYFMSAMLIIE